jgi:hypothetical protein
MSAEDFLNNLMEQYSEENAEFVSVADVDDYGNVVFSNSIVESASPEMVQHAINLIQPEVEE